MVVRRLLSVLLLVLAAAGCDSHDPPGSDNAPQEPSPPARGDAASFLAFAEGGEAPAFDAEVDVSVGDRVVLTLTREQAQNSQAWSTADGSLLRGVADWRTQPPPGCIAVPSPVGPALRHDVNARGMSVVWRPHACDFAVRLLIDRSDEIAAVAFDVP